MELTRWGLWVRGIIRTVIELGDENGDVVAKIDWDGKSRYRHAVAVDRDGEKWSIDIDAHDVTVTRAKAPGPSAAVRGGVLTLGTTHCTWDFDHDTSRTGIARAERAGVILRTAPGRVRRNPWATIDVDTSLDDHLALALAGSLMILALDAQITGGMARFGSGGGSGGP